MILFEITRKDLAWNTYTREAKNFLEGKGASIDSCHEPETNPILMQICKQPMFKELLTPLHYSLTDSKGFGFLTYLLNDFRDIALAVNSELYQKIYQSAISIPPASRNQRDILGMYLILKWKLINHPSESNGLSAFLNAVTPFLPWGFNGLWQPLSWIRQCAEECDKLLRSTRTPNYEIFFENYYQRNFVNTAAKVILEFQNTFFMFPSDHYQQAQHLAEYPTQENLKEINSFDYAATIAKCVNSRDWQRDPPPAGYDPKSYKEKLQHNLKQIKEMSQDIIKEGVSTEKKLIYLMRKMQNNDPLLKEPLDLLAQTHNPHYVVYYLNLKNLTPCNILDRISQQLVLNRLDILRLMNGMTPPRFFAALQQLGDSIGIPGYHPQTPPLIPLSESDLKNLKTSFDLEYFRDSTISTLLNRLENCPRIRPHLEQWIIDNLMQDWKLMRDWESDNKCHIAGVLEFEIRGFLTVSATIQNQKETLFKNLWEFISSRGYRADLDMQTYRSDIERIVQVYPYEGLGYAIKGVIDKADLLRRKRKFVTIDFSLKLQKMLVDLKIIQERTDRP